MFKFRYVLLVCLLIVPSISAAQVDEPFFMTFIPNVQFSQMYVGIEKGYFAEAGFDLQLEYGDEPDGVNLIAAGQRNFGLIAGEQVIVARSNDLPVVSVYEWWQQYPVGVVLPEGSGIEGPADLAGLRIGVPGRFGASYSGIIALLTAGGLTEADITLDVIGFNAPEVVCVGGVQGSTVYVNNEPLQIAARANAGDCGDVTGVEVISVSDYVDLVSNGLVTNEQLIAEQPDVVAAMTEAFHRAVTDVINNPAEAYLLSAPYIENLPLSDALEAALVEAADAQIVFLATDPTRADVAASRDALFEDLSAAFTAEELLQMEVLLETVVLWDADALGIADLSSWEVTQETLIGMGFVDAPIDVGAAFTNDFVPTP